MIIINKTLVKKQFNSGLNTYPEEAAVQKSIAKKLIFELCSLNLPRCFRLFEVGCGTGFLTQNIIENIAFDELMVNDITTTSKHKIRELAGQYSNQIKFIEGDAEEIDFPQQLDAVLSGSTIQWFTNKRHFFDRVHKSLKPYGILAFSTFGCDNFREIMDLTGIGLEYQCLWELTEMLSGKFNILSGNEWTEKVKFDTPLAVLRHIKQSGVNAIQQHFWSRRQLNAFTDGYYQLFSSNSNSITLTYNPIIIVAQKKHADE